MTIVDAAHLVPPADPAQNSTEPKNTLASADRCRYGRPFCINGAAEHGMCNSRSVILWVPGNNGRLDRVLEVAVEAYEETDTPVLAWSGDGHSGVPISSNLLRQIADQAAAHAPKLAAFADEYDALFAPAAFTPARVTRVPRPGIDEPLEGPLVTLVVGDVVISAVETRYFADGKFPDCRDLVFSDGGDSAELSYEQAQELPAKIREFADNVEALLANFGKLGGDQ